MHILLTGGTGLIGRQLCRHWLTQGHQLTVWSRRPTEVPKLCGAQVRGIARLDELAEEPVDAIINLAGAPIADRPWTHKRKALLWSSRITLTEKLLAWLESRGQKPGLLISGSAVGWYGDGGERELNEDSPPVSEDFASQLCIAWEETAQRAEAMGLRVVLIRTGLVLAAEGGFLSRLLLPFKLALGGPIGNGRQWMPWIHIKDQIALIDFLLHRSDASGPYNACAPRPVRNREFAKTLGSVLRRPAVVPVPAFVLRVGLGELSLLLLGGQRAVPARLQAAGFTFQFTDLRAALDDLSSRL
ncbi:TIGR01777 family oxidoreductase [Pseudomonas chlororaphis]|uniref:TIGR01777 family oxidoreductase n=1 Tax=Pseudomonas chlororaphis TaxID=587753 RepID=UPI0006A585D9|nr:TIGR01777 family oxidoreductase [Pseudomonas chlororaphis]AZD04387.1 Cell division inhibitor YfcH-like [Pseudomonas chlororaphis subsp. chlororaphis]MBM0281472.1 TIGR01777 family protein [Pseudomonas chlororaphis]MDO1502784.1 TIGR01777 family protein [Pseudomonas chlororaphis]ORM46261.1 epimerase [Pseudomonas chlororaphis subsp. chlororaphis]TWR97561.1 TIGR01777 family protein [Pseudomonas chlororaphis subsp. chlororaphis]